MWFYMKASEPEILINPNTSFFLLIGNFDVDSNPVAHFVKIMKVTSASLSSQRSQDNKNVEVQYKRDD